MIPVRHGFTSLSIVAIGFFYIASAFAAEGHFVTQEQVDLVRLLAPPPARGSKEAKADMEAVLRAQAQRTPRRVKEAKADRKDNVLRFADVFGSKFTADALPLTTAFFAKVVEDRGLIVDAAKAFWHNPRPSAVNPAVKPIFPPPEADSYPSGHATFAYLAAIILADMVPEKAPQLFARAAEFAHNRVVAGMHYPSDIEAGRISATVIAAVMMLNPVFRQDFAAVKAEVRHVLGYSPEGAVVTK